MGRVYRFSARIDHRLDIPFMESFPIFDEYGEQIIGAFTHAQPNVVTGFISGAGHPTALLVSTGESFFFTPVEGLNHRMIDKAVVTPVATSLYSIKIKAEES